MLAKLAFMTIIAPLLRRGLALTGYRSSGMNKVPLCSLVQPSFGNSPVVEEHRISG